ncbi:MAG: hypothetical protein IPK19_27635 [Chloroflexi bacterium]|nr:hypothetical protein [Chloroflexota bacterium]
MTVESLLQEIRALAVPERKRLIGLIVDTLTDEPAEPGKKHSILEFEGVGAEMWKSVDVQAYLDELRNEWDEPK